MDTVTFLIIWLSAITLFGLLTTTASVYFVWWFLSVRNPKLTELLVDAYHLKNEDKLK
jgi:hypothetical protein